MKALSSELLAVRGFLANRTADVPFLRAKSYELTATALSSELLAVRGFRARLAAAAPFLRAESYELTARTGGGNV
jgi:hypothetical protein